MTSKYSFGKLIFLLRVFTCEKMAYKEMQWEKQNNIPTVVDAMNFIKLFLKCLLTLQQNHCNNTYSYSETNKKLKIKKLITALLHMDYFRENSKLQSREGDIANSKLTISEVNKVDVRSHW